MKIENRFIIDASVDEAWNLLTDIAQIAPCLPGATLADESDGVYSGSVKVKVGPVTAEYRGTAEFIERDDDRHRAVIDGKGRDTRGAGNAQALITAALRDVDRGTEVDIATELKITGRVAQFGRGVMQDVSEKLLGQFVECLAMKLEGEGALEAMAAASAGDLAHDPVVVDGPGRPPNPGARVTSDSPNGEVLDLLDVAGGAVAKRAVPAALLFAAIVVALVLVLV